MASSAPIVRDRSGRLRLNTHQSSKPALMRFLSHVRVSATGCWEWQGTKNHKGYGFFARGRGQGKAVAHRWAYEQYRGEIPAGFYVCHHCDNPSCVNPAHLFAGTGSDNMRDCVRKGRHRSPFVEQS